MGNGCPCYHRVNPSWEPIPHPPPEKCVEDFVIVWLNPSLDQDPAKTGKIQELKKHVNLVVTCTHLEQCQDFINDIKDEKVFVIVSGSLVKEVTSKTLKFPKAESVYCLSTPGEAKKIRRTNGAPPVFTTIELLSDHLGKDVKRCERNLVKPLIIESDEEKISCMYDRLVRDVILASKDKNLDDLVQVFKEVYQDNVQETQFLDEFAHSYTTSPPIYWYTRENCLYKVLNTTLRKRDYKHLYAMRVYIRDLHEDIANRHKQGEYGDRTWYRGQALKKSLLECIVKNERKTIFFPDFLSTSLKRHVAKKFAQDSIKDPENTELVKMLFEIKVDENVRFPFADISAVSFFPHEAEWLLSMGSSFRVDAVECQSDEIKVMKLTLINDDYDEKVIQLIKHLKKFVKDENICLSLARIMHQKGDWSRSEFFYNEALKKERDQYDRVAAIRNNLGSIAFETGKYEQALKHYEEAIELEENEDRNSENLVFNYQNIATVYYNQGKLDSADKTLQKAIDIHNRSLNGDWNTAATIYNNMAHVLNSQGKHDQALTNNRKCLRIRRRILPEIHPSLAIAYNSMAITFNHLRLSSEDKENSDEVEKYAQDAFNYVGKAVNIDRQSLPSDHPQTKNHKKNLEHFEKINTQ